MVAKGGTGLAELASAPGSSAKARFVRVTPMKARRVIDLIRGMKASEALTVLQFAPQAASEPIYKLLASAIANAQNSPARLDPESLVVFAATVDEGPTMKRFRPRAQGRAFRIRKRTSHISIELRVAATQRPRRAAKRTARGANAGSSAAAKGSEK